MKKNITLILSLILAGNVFSQIQYSNSNDISNNFIKNLSGPRVGFTIITDGELKENLISEFDLT